MKRSGLISTDTLRRFDVTIDGVGNGLEVKGVADLRPGRGLRRTLVLRSGCDLAMPQHRPSSLPTRRWVWDSYLVDRFGNLIPTSRESRRAGGRGFCSVQPAGGVTVVTNESPAQHTCGRSAFLAKG